MSDKDTALVTAVRELVVEFRRARRWRLLIGLGPVLILLLILLVVSSDRTGMVSPSGEHTALVDISGIIVPDALANADHITRGLRAAFEEDQVKGVLLRINSPGGSPVQAHRVHTEISRLRNAHPNKPVYAVVEDICASGAYYIAVAAEEIHADESSLVGSIGVIVSGFGMVDLIDEWGIERRVTKSGKYKDMLDPFKPETSEEKAYIQDLVDRIHQRFVLVVQDSRGERLKEEQSSLYDGRIWTGEQAHELGLLDGFASADQIAREKIGAEQIVNYTYEPDFLEEFGSRVGSRMMQWLETQLHMPRWH